MRLSTVLFSVILAAGACNRGLATDEDRGTGFARAVESTPEATGPGANAPVEQPLAEPVVEAAPTQELAETDPGVGGIYGTEMPARAASEGPVDPSEADPWTATSTDPWAPAATPTPAPAESGDDPWTATSADPWAPTKATNPTKPAPIDQKPIRVPAESPPQP